jgi:predicted ArsR family transcriptional regulator
MTKAPEDLEPRILELLKTRLLSVSQIAKELKIRRDFTTGYLEALKNQGKLEFHCIGKSNVYTIAGRTKK